MLPGGELAVAEKQVFFDGYPCWIVLVSNAFSIAVYALGAFLMLKLGAAFLAAYLLCVVFLEARVLKKSCVNCFYYGKTCAFGKGRVAALFFSAGKPGAFAKRQISWKDVAPDFLIFIVPVAAGVWFLIQAFDWMLLGAVVLLLILGFAGNAFVRGSLACKHCAQRKIGCPAERLFNKQKK